MMELVRVALRRPYTVAVLSLLVLLLGGLAVTRMVVDFFPEDRHSGRVRGLELSRPVRRGNGTPRHHHQRARLLDDGQRHRPHRNEKKKKD